jgi:hypothetical protein
MTLLDTNVIVDALDRSQANHQWAKKQIEDVVAEEGGGISVVTLAELCAGARNPLDAEPEIKRLGLTVHDLPAVAATCGKAYRRYVIARRNSGGGLSPKMPLPDFFIGAQAEVMDWKIATRDHGRFEKYFPTVALVTPRFGGTACLCVSSGALCLFAKYPVSGTISSGPYSDGTDMSGCSSHDFLITD